MKRALIILLLVSSFGISLCQKYTLYSSVSCGGSVLPVSSILEQRIPSVPLYSVPSACQNIVKQKLREFRNYDLQNIDRIVNEYCSHQNGWVEYQAGICQAGGPPPICPKNHWYRDILASVNQWNKKIAELLISRDGDVKKIACNCLGNSLSVAFETENQKTFKALSSKADIKGDQNETLTLPCLQIDGADPCPPNYVCREGFCILKSAAQQSLSKLNNGVTRELVSTLLGDNIIQSVLNKYSIALGAIFKTYSSPYSKILDPTSISTNVNGYSKAANNLKDNFQEFYRRLTELNRYYHNQAPARDKSYIVHDINMVKAKMKNNFNLLNEFRNGIDIENEHCKDCCEDAFNEYHKQLGTYYSVFSSLNF